MMESMIGFIEAALPYLIVIIVVVQVWKMIQSMLPNTGEKEREKKTPLERYYNTLASHISMDNMKSGSTLKIRGDSNIPARKIGGLVGATKRRNFFVLGLREYWWKIPKIWKDVNLLFVPDEFIHDLYQGDVMVDEAVSLDVINEKFATVAVAEDYSDYDDKSLQKKVQRFIDTDIKRMMDIDLNNDIIENAKAGLRGGRQYSSMERMRPEKPPKKDVDEIERERKKKEYQMDKDKRKQEVKSSGGGF